MGSAKRSKKRKAKHHTGNQYTNNAKKAKVTEPTPPPPTTDETIPKEVPCASGTKIIQDSTSDADETDTNMIFDFAIFKEIIHSIGRCRGCPSDLPLIVETDASKAHGFVHSIVIHCSVCGWKSDFFTSKIVESYPLRTDGRGKKPFVTNVQVVTAFREIGKGFEPLTNFCRISNIRCPNKKAFTDINSKLMTAYKQVADESMSNAAKNVHSSCEENKNGIGVCRVSLDGSWQRRGHNSLNGLVSVISQGKCIDVQVMSKYCKGCTMWKNKEGTPEYDRWKGEHICSINHEKSSGSMESAGAVQMFTRSIAKNNLIYDKYLGDGDSSSFKDVVDSNPYSEHGIIPKKDECVGHVQKRVGTRLRKIAKDYRKEEPVVDKKGNPVMKDGKQVKKIIKISGKGKLTDTVINSMQNFYGLAIRNNTTNLYAMKKAVWAILHHCTAFEDNKYRHQFCPPGETTWCKWKFDQLKGTKTYKPHVNIPKWIYNIIKPIFVDLSDETLLRKCLHGLTQNVNEALNQIIWTKIPKSIFVGKHLLEMGVHSAIIEYNDGATCVGKVLKLLGVEAGYFYEKATIKRNTKRIINSRRKSSEKGIARRKSLRTIKKGFLDKEKEQEKEKSYEYGGF